MLPGANEACQTPPKFGLKRSPGTSKLRPQLMKLEENQMGTKLLHSISMANIGKNIFTQDASTPQSKPRLPRTKTATGPLKLEHASDTPVRSRMIIEATTSSTNEVTPPNNPTIRRTSSGTMLLRQTPDRVRRQEDEEIDSPRKFKRSGSVPKMERADTPKRSEEFSTPISKRKRTNSASLLPSTPDSMIGLTSPTRRRPREPSIEPSSPIKKRSKNETPKSSPRKFVSMASIIMSKGRFLSSIIMELLLEDTPTINLIAGSPLKRYKSSVIEVSRKEEEKIIIPEVERQSTSTETYHSAIEYVLPTPKMEVYLTPQSSFGEEMRPLVKKQISVNEQVVKKEKLAGEEPREEEDEGFGDSMKTIKRGQGAMLARSVSLKLSASPKKSMEPSVAETEKASSTPAIPSVPQLQKSASLSFRFRVSPSTLCLKVDPSTSVTPPTPSTPKTLATPKKSLLKMTPGVYTPRQDGGSGRVKKIRFDRLDVYYFERKQGTETVPQDGDIALDMHNQHHTKRQFPLRYGGGRPNLGLELQSNDDLSDGEVVSPDSDDEEVDDHRPTAKDLCSLNAQHRIKVLEDSGVQIEKTESLHRFRNERGKCGCSCKKGVCLPETCQCALDGINCQVDGDYEYPCKCRPEKCANPNGLLHFDADKVHEFRSRTITNYKASLKSGIDGSPRVTKFVDSDDEDDEEKNKNPMKFPVTPVYPRRSRSNLSDIRESTSGEASAAQVVLMDRFEELKSLDNDVCVEEVQNENDVTVCPSTSSSSSSLASSDENLAKIDNAPIIEQLPNLVVSL